MYNEDRSTLDHGRASRQTIHSSDSLRWLRSACPQLYQSLTEHLMVSDQLLASTTTEDLLQSTAPSINRHSSSRAAARDAFAATLLPITAQEPLACRPLPQPTDSGCCFSLNHRNGRQHHLQSSRRDEHLPASPSCPFTPAVTSHCPQLSRWPCATSSRKQLPYVPAQQIAIAPRARAAERSANGSAQRLSPDHNRRVHF